jgi:hypothetical protein
MIDAVERACDIPVPEPVVDLGEILSERGEIASDREDGDAENPEPNAGEDHAILFPRRELS